MSQDICRVKKGRYYKLLQVYEKDNSAGSHWVSILSEQMNDKLDGYLDGKASKSASEK